MHPEIKKFWQDEGYSIPFQDDPALGTVSGYKPIDGAPYISKIEILAFGDKYRFKGEWYSEEEMLRIIHLKAFI
jgi:hypothetical protein